MTVLQYNTIPAEHQPLVAEAPKKKYGGRVVAAAVAAALTRHGGGRLNAGLPRGLEPGFVYGFGLWENYATQAGYIQRRAVGPEAADVHQRRGSRQDRAPSRFNRLSVNP